ncbi:MAG: hypothetical protein QOJ01_261 [Solirubrobacterales bacterium]|nr:hypothetical protein [Gaiellaceae bacterium]MDX6636750.1 hypothetical protein [Solirubrobacterales bacterium]
MAATAVVAGCGSGTDTSSIATVASSTTTTSGPLSRSSFIQQADEICAESSAAINSIVPGSTSAEQASATAQQLAVTRDELRSLQSLGAPQGASPSAYLSALGSVNAQLGRKHLALQRGDVGSLATIAASLDTAEAKARSAASSYGFRKCGNVGSPAGSSVNTATSSTTTTTPVTPTTPTVVTPTTPTTAPPDTGGGSPAPITPPNGGSGGGGTGGVGPGSGGSSP